MIISRAGMTCASDGDADITSTPAQMAGRNQRRFLVLNRFTDWSQRMRSLFSLATRGIGPACFFTPCTQRSSHQDTAALRQRFCFLEMPPELPTLLSRAEGRDEIRYDDRTRGKSNRSCDAQPKLSENCFLSALTKCLSLRRPTASGVKRFFRIREYCRPGRSAPGLPASRFAERQRLRVVRRFCFR